MTTTSKTRNLRRFRAILVTMALVVAANVAISYAGGLDSMGSVGTLPGMGDPRPELTTRGSVGTLPGMGDPRPGSTTRGSVGTLPGMGDPRP